MELERNNNERLICKQANDPSSGKYALWIVNVAKQADH